MSTREQRQLVREMCDLLRSDLYKRDGGGDDFARWVSPLGWAVEYGYNADGQTVWTRIIDPRGEPFDKAENADVSWLDGALP